MKHPIRMLALRRWLLSNKQNRTIFGLYGPEHALRDARRIMRENLKAKPVGKGNRAVRRLKGIVLHPDRHSFHKGMVGVQDTTGELPSIMRNATNFLNGLFYFN